MFQEEVKLSCGEDRYKIFISAIVTQDGVSATITGGEKPHVGGMAMSIPRPGQVENKPSCDTWITPRPGHRDSEAAALVSKMMCMETGLTAAVIAGIHIDQAERREIDMLLENCREAARLLCNKIKEIINTCDA